MDNDKLKLIKQELRISGKDLVTVNIIKPAVYFYSEGYTVKREGAADKFNRVLVNNKAQSSIDCYGITNAALVMEALIIDREYLPDEEWEIIAFTDCISMCPLTSVGNLKKQKMSDDKFNYGGKL